MIHVQLRFITLDMQHSRQNSPVIDLYLYTLIVLIVLQRPWAHGDDTCLFNNRQNSQNDSLYSVKCIFKSLGHCNSISLSTKHAQQTSLMILLIVRMFWLVSMHGKSLMVYINFIVSVICITIHSVT